MPGFVLVLAIAIAARLLSRFSGIIPDVVLALVLGLIVRNAFTLPASIQPGIGFTLRYILRAAIILFGAGLTFEAALRTGVATLSLVVICVVIAMGLGLSLARGYRLPGNIGTLIGVGTSICGGSAILAIAPLIRAKDEEVAYAISAIFTFNVIALLVYPPIGHALHLSPTAFGSWTGTAVNDTSVVVATGYLYGPDAGAVATIVKLARTILLVPLALGIGIAYAARFRREEHGMQAEKTPANLWHYVRGTVPWFVVGFMVVAALNSAGAFSKTVAHDLVLLAGFLIVIVLAAVGLNVDIAKIRKLGIRPLGVGLLVAAVMAFVSLSLVDVLGIR